VKRLSAATVAGAVGAEVPTYDRSVEPTVVHIGVGAFARAHLAVYADDLLQRGVHAAIQGVSLRSARAEEELGAQDGLYTVTTREPGAVDSTRVIGSLTSVQTGPAAAADAIAAPSTSIVTLTVTEKGYELAGPDSVPRVLAAALDARRRRTDRPLIVVSLDNLADNGNVLREVVLRGAATLDPSLHSWIADSVQFPRSVVDRMVPATAPEDRDEIGRRLGLIDRAAVVAEAHRSWILESIDEPVPLRSVGVEVVADIEPYQRRKLWLLNGPHSAFAYCGLLAGHQTIADATDDPLLTEFVRRLVEDVLEVMPLGDLDLAAFADSSLQRFANPALEHTCAQVAADGSQKLPQRLLPVMDLRSDRHLGVERFALVFAAWMVAATATKVAGSELPTIEDPDASHLREALGRGTQEAAAAALSPLYERHVPVVTQAFERLVRDGVQALKEHT
jgi:fructuronate reductase